MVKLMKGINNNVNKITMNLTRRLYMLKNIMQSFSDKRDITSPIFKKEFDNAPAHLTELENLLTNNSGNIDTNLVKRDIDLFKQGLFGESAVNYELRNSMLPFIGFHDVRIEDGDLSAQIDFIVVSHSVIYIIETKKLYGDIEINSSGEFIRKFKNKSGRVVRTEGMYSPITQSARHVRILSEFLKKNGLIKILPVKSIVVLANPKSIVNKSKAPKDIQKSIIKVDQLVDFLSKEFTVLKKKNFMLDKQVYEIADFISENHQPKPLDLEKYYLETDEVAATVEVEEKPEPVETVNEQPLKEEELSKELKAFRLAQSKKENVKAYLIFYNSTLDELVAEKPSTSDELLKISGFGKVKVDKYGVEIIEIIKKYV